MTDHANELRRYARKIAHPAGDVPAVMLAAADEIERLQSVIAGLRAEVIHWKEQKEPGAAGWRALARKLQAKVEEMERQEPVARFNWGKGKLEWLRPWNYSTMNMKSLYLASGAQPTPSVPEGWLRAVDEALVVAHIGVANTDDTYEQAKTKLDNLIGFHVDIATDPSVNGGYKLVPIESAPEAKP